jgi:hypothetical protein
MSDSSDKTVSEGLGYKPMWTITKYKKETDPGKIAVRSKMLQAGLTVEDMRNVGFDPYAVEQVPHNISLKVGRAQVCTVLSKTAVASTRWSSGIAYLFVGTHSTAASYTQSGLLAAAGSRAKYKMDTGYPSVSSNTITWRSTFTTNTANFAWKEYSLRNSTTQTTGKALNRVASSKGTKVNGETWTLQLVITVT